MSESQSQRDGTGPPHRLDAALAPVPRDGGGSPVCPEDGVQPAGRALSRHCAVIVQRPVTGPAHQAARACDGGQGPGSEPQSPPAGAELCDWWSGAAGVCLSLPRRLPLLSLSGCPSK